MAYIKPASECDCKNCDGYKKLPLDAYKARACVCPCHQRSVPGSVLFMKEKPMNNEQTFGWREAARRWANGEEIQFRPYTDTEWVNFNDAYGASFEKGCIYRIKPTPPKRVPLEAKDVPPGSCLGVKGLIGKGWSAILSVGHKGISINLNSLTFEELMDGYEISRDNGKTWSPCWKEEV